MKGIAGCFVGHHSAEKRTEACVDRVIVTVSNVSSDEVLELLQQLPLAA